MKLFEHGVYNALAIGASDISLEQADVIKQLGLDIEVVLCYDKGITLDGVRTQAKLFKGRKVFAMYDIDNILEGKKSAPIDEGIDKWNLLVEDYIFPIDLEEEIE
jgi:DNA primase